MNEAPIGRRAAFNTIKSRLADPKPGVILVAGAAGSGRTHMLQHLTAAAERLGYRILYGTGAEPLTIELSTTRLGVRRRLESLIAEGTECESRPTDNAVDEGEIDAQIIELFGRASPLLVAIDGFRPTPAFDAWFTGVLLPKVRELEDRVALVVTDRAEALQSLSKIADLTVTLGPLDSDEVSAQISSAAVGLSPELTSEELRRYVEAAVEQPAILSALLAVFQACGPAHAGVPT